MPIRRAPATPEKSTSAAAEKEPEGSSEEVPSADDEQAPSSAAVDESEAAAEPTENGEEENGEEKADEAAAAEEKEGDGGEDGAEKKDDKCKDGTAGQCATHCSVLLLRLKDGYKYEKSKVKKVKRTIPAWASVSASKKLPVTNYAGTHHKVDNIVIEALTSCNERSGVSYQSVMKYIMKKYPVMDEKKFLIKKAMKKHLEKGTIKQLKGKGLSGTFTIGKQTALSKKNAQNKESLGDALPLIITRLCEPKEASYIMIKKYLEQHFPSLNVENRPDVLKSALVRAVERGQLEQITGKGANGTFQLKRTGSKVLLKGGALEDAIIAAITAMNEPKTCSTTTLRKYLVDANKDRKEYQLVSSLRRTLTKCKVLGWMEQITGHGFTGTYQLSFPYYPSPTILYPDKYKDPPKKNTAAPAKRRRTAHSSDEEESEEEEEEEEEDDESEEEVAPRRRSAQKRPPPKARRPPPQKKSRSASQSKAKGSGRQVAKKSPAKKPASPAKKPASPAKRSGKKAAASKKKAAPKATPVKKAAPARKPKTPAVKRLSKRGSRQQESEPESSSSDEAPPAKSPRAASKRSQPEDAAEEPAPKKPAAKGRRSKAEESPADEPPAKQAAKGKSKPPARKSRRGRH
ncbi:heterochromatin protein 1-binding protein 3 isoform X2 [Salarias fasciatus]|uniref:Heterochromatin protein 1-binding protein 3 n=1 Tax=Salarias fasciatus TaxID=181472 RepID=A0A672H665_SALFA|nr:heterochromatin protein 1-binding protein 3 isoform X2 [Salarias fasciatus]